MFSVPELEVCMSCRASEPKQQKHSSAQKVGFPPIPERVPKSAEKVRTFYAKSVVFRTFLHFRALFLESVEAPLSVQINVFAIWALRLDRKYTKLEWGY